MFDLDEFLTDCRAAVGEAEARRAIRETLTRAMAQPAEVGATLRPREGGLTLLSHDPDLTVIHLVWAPAMQLFPHDHRMWAAIGIYAGQEDNTFYRRSGAEPRARSSSRAERLCAEGDVLMLGDDTIHGVANPTPPPHRRDPRVRRRLRESAAESVGSRASRRSAPSPWTTLNRQFADANRTWADACVELTRRQRAALALEERPFRGIAVSSTARSYARAASS